MPDFGVPHFAQSLALISDVQSSPLGIRLTGNASANTKGNYSTLEAALAFDVSGMLVMSNGSQEGDMLVDIAVGAASSENIILPNLYFSSRGGQVMTNPYYFPIKIAKGARLAGRLQHTTGSNFGNIACLLFSPTFLNPSPPSYWIAIGQDLTDSCGTEIDPGAVANTFGGYVELTASLSHPLGWVYLVLGNKNNNARVAANWEVQLAMGAGGSEQVIASVIANSATVPDHITPQVFMLPLTVPSGVRLAAQARCNSTDATGRLLDTMLYGGVL